jgi:hypothetical protein
LWYAPLVLTASFQTRSGGPLQQTANAATSRLRKE